VSLWPWRLCRELWVDHRLRVGRVLRFGLIWALVIHLSAFALTLGSAVMTGSNIPVVYRMGSWQYPDLWNPEFWMQAGRMLAFPYAFDMIIPRGFASSVRPPLGPIFLLIFGPALLMPMWMTLLGSSMQIARVRPVHLLRGLCLSLPSAAAWVILTFAAIVVTEVFTSFPAPGVASVAILAWLPYHLTWWYLFVRVYLRLRHAAAVVILNAVMSVLLIVVSFVLFMLNGIRF